MHRPLIALALGLGLTACHARHAGAQTEPSPVQAFMATNAKAPGVVTLPDGLEYKIVASGPADGAKPLATDEVKVDYEGKLMSGQVFDSSFARGVPADLPLQGLIPAWTEALQLMRPGDEWILYVPPALGYGDAGAGDKIPPNATLIFTIELLAINPAP